MSPKGPPRYEAVKWRMEKSESTEKRKVKKYNWRKRKDLLIQYKAGKQSQAAFAREHGIKNSTFAGWVKRYQNEEKKQANENIKLIEVKLEGQNQKSRPINFEYKVVFTDDVELQFSEVTEQVTQLINNLRTNRY